MKKKTSITIDETVLHQIDEFNGLHKDHPINKSLASQAGMRAELARRQEEERLKSY